MNTCDPMSDTNTTSTHEVFIASWSMVTGSSDVQLFGQLHTDLSNVPLFVLPGVKLQIELTKDRPSFYLMNKTADSNFKYL